MGLLLLGLLFALGFLCLKFIGFKQEARGLEVSQLAGLPALRELDLVFRMGVDLDSALIASLSRSKFSHIGIIISTEPLRVLHASSSDTQSKVAISSFEYFLSKAKAFGVKRYEGLEHKEEIIKRLKSFVGRDFVISADEDRLYCTTLLEDNLKPYLALNLAYEDIELPLLRGKYLFPQAFWQDEKSSLVYEFVP